MSAENSTVKNEELDVVESDELNELTDDLKNLNVKDGGETKVKEEEVKQESPSVPFTPTRPAPKSKKSTPRTPKYAFWSTLTHNGPLFPPEYKRLPKNFLKYNRQPLELSSKAEEALTIYASNLHIIKKRATERDDKEYRKKVNDNFVKDWKTWMDESDKKWLETELEKNGNDIGKLMGSFNLEEIAEVTKPIKYDQKIQDNHRFALYDGVEEELINYKIRPPGMFFGKSACSFENCRDGQLKKRIVPEDVTINCSKNHAIPPPPGQEWKGVVENIMVKWAFEFEEEKNNNDFVKAMPKETSKVDRKKFDKAREIAKALGGIRREYTKDMTSLIPETREHGTLLFLVDRHMFRVGDTKQEEEEEANRSGLQLLRKDFKYDESGNTLGFRFPGKAGVEWTGTIDDELAVKNLKNLIENKAPDDKIFQNISRQTFKTYLHNIMPDLNAKDFRTCHASCKFQDVLDKTVEQDDNKKKVEYFKQAVEKVAKLCNHEYSDNTLLFYVDPRITFYWCKKHNVVVSKVLRKKLVTKFKWAAKEVGENKDYKFYTKTESVEQPTSSTSQ